MKISNPFDRFARLVALSLVSLPLLAGGALAQDLLSVGTRTASVGPTSVTVPVTILDTSGTPLGVDRPAGARIQGISFQIVWTNPAVVASVSIARAGILAPLTPQFEAAPQSGNAISYVASFNETTDPIPFVSGSASLVANLTVNLNSTAAPGTVVDLLVTRSETVTVLSNDAGTSTETFENGGLAVGDGQITIPASTLTLTPGSQSFFVGKSGTITASLSLIQPTATVVTLTSSNPAIASVPASVTIPANTTSASFPVTGVAPGGVITIGGALPAAIGGSTATAEVSVFPVAITLTPPSMTIKIGTSGTLVVGINDVRATDTLVTLSSSDATIASVPASVTIPAGATTASFLVTGAGGGGPVTITATMPAPLGALQAASQITVQAVVLSLLPASQTILIGGTGVMTAEMDRSQPTATVVSLLSTNPAVATAPLSVTINAGQTRSNFIVTAVSVGGPIGIVGTLPASIGGGSAVGTVTVAPVEVSLIPASTVIDCGGAATLTVSASPIQGSPLVVALASANPAVVAVPASVTIPGGQASTTFLANGVGVGGPVDVTATLPIAVGGDVAASAITVGPQTISLAPSAVSLQVGTIRNLTVTIGSPAGAATAINLTSSAPSVATVPPSVTIPAGSVSTLVPVSGIAPGGPVTITASLSAGCGATSAATTVTVSAMTLTLQPSSLTLAVGSGATIEAVLSAPAAQNVVVAIASSDPTIAAVSAPQVTIPAGSTRGSFGVAGVAIGGPVTITATPPAWTGGAPATAQVTVAGIGVGLSPCPLTLVAGAAKTMTVTLSEVQPNNIGVELVSADPAKVQVPSIVVIPAGELTATFVLNALKPTLVPVTVSAILPATLGGVQISCSVTVVGPIYIGIVPSVLTIAVGGIGQLMVLLDQPAPQDLHVAIASSSPGIVSAPAEVVIPEGAKEGTFTVSGIAPGGPIPVSAKLPASVGGQAAVANVSVSGGVVLLLTPPAVTIGIGETAILTAALNVAQSAMTTVELLSSDPSIASVGASVTIPAGQKSASVAVTGRALGGPVTITAKLPASLGGGSALSAVTVVSGSLTFEPRLALPGQAHSRGAEGAFFRSSVWISNPSVGESSIVRLVYYPSTGPALGAGRELTIRPTGIVAYADVLAELFGAREDASGTLVVEVVQGRSTPIVTARTFNDAGGLGTFGQYIPAVPIGGSSTADLWLHGLGGDSATRTNVGVVNLGPNPIAATLSVVDDKGVPKGHAITVTVPGFSTVQTSKVNEEAGAGALSNFGVRVSATGRFFAYASKLDNRTNDPIFIPAGLRSLDRQWVDGLASIAGADGKIFRSNLSLTNRASAPASAVLRLFERGGSTLVAEASVVVAGGESKFYLDAIHELFGLDGFTGRVDIETSVATPIVAWARTYTDLGAAGTFGQFIPAFGPADLLGASGAVFQGVAENASFRTNAGFVNVSDASVTASVEAWAGGTLIGTRSYVVERATSRFVFRILEEMGLRGASDVVLVVRPSAGSAIYAWASMVDNVSTDQTFLRPISLP
jgi:hypothetical protein